MFKKFYLFAVFLVFLFHGNTQETILNEKFGPDQLKCDLQILVSDLKASHPGLYEYTTPETFDSLANAFEQGLTDSLTQAAFHLRIRKFLRFIGCGHTSAMPSLEWYSSLKGKAKLIPIQVFLHDNQLYVRKAVGENLDSLVGSRIISIDGVSCKDVISEIKSIIGRDGLGETLPDRNLQRLFTTYYLFAFGMSEKYRLELEKPNGEIATIDAKGRNPGRFSVHNKHELIDVIEASQAQFGFIDSTHKTAVMDLNSFPSGGFKKFYRKSFRELAESGSETLILDLRGNGGGYFPNGNHLLRHLMQAKFTMDFSRERKQGKRSKYIKTDISGKITRFIFTTIPDRNKEDPDRNYQIRFKPIKRHQFEGQVYIITNGWTFSTASFVASKLKNSRNAIIVGEETGGGEVAFNAVLKWYVTLPNSSVRVILPMYHIDIQPEMEDVGRGVIPTIPVEYETIQQKIDGIDLELTKILQIL